MSGLLFFRVLSGELRQDVPDFLGVAVDAIVFADVLRKVNGVGKGSLVQLACFHVRVDFQVQKPGQVEFDVIVHGVYLLA